MHFVSALWVVLMAVTIGVYWILPEWWRNRGLVATTCVFLVAYAPQSTILLCLFAMWTYGLANRPLLSTRRLVVACSGIVLVLTAFKLGAGINFEGDPGGIAIPLGLSYYSFRCMHYLFERYKGTLDRHGFKEFLGYLFFLPTIVVGPINRFDAFLRDVRRQRWSSALMSEGLERVLYGYVKITVLGNFLVTSQFRAWIDTLQPGHPALGGYLHIVRFGLNAYLQFAGFSDVAIGFALLLGYRVIENFNWPYLQKNISAFWRSWHISLTSWCRDYVYGSVFAVSRSPALGAVATLVVIGLWHEISLRYLLWGLFHGSGLIVWQRFQSMKRHLPTITHPLGRRLVEGGCILLTANFVWFSFVLVAQPTLARSWDVYRTVLFWWAV